jgi:peptide/nickel transport system permease protein
MMPTHFARIAGAALLAVVAVGAIAAPVLATNGTDARFRDLLHVPPTWPHIWHSGSQMALPNSGGAPPPLAGAPRLGSSQQPQARPEARGGFHWPFIYPWRLVSRLEQRYEEDRSRPVPLVWFSGGKLVRSSSADAPFLPLGADSFGRDIFARLLYGARTSLALAVMATIGALLIGTLIGAVAGIAGRTIDELLMRLAELIIILPTVYVVLVLRAALHLVLEAHVVFGLMTTIFALVGWPFVARGVRGIVASEKRRDYAIAAQSLGAGRARLVFRHLLPACGGFVAVQATLLVPAFIIAEATLSYVGLGFLDPVASWGSMLHDASDIVALTEFPWTLAPAGAIFAIVLGFNLVVQRSPYNDGALRFEQVHGHE